MQSVIYSAPCLLWGELQLLWKHWQARSIHANNLLLKIRMLYKLLIKDEAVLCTVALLQIGAELISGTEKKHT